MASDGEHRDARALAAVLDALPERVIRYRADDLTILYANLAMAREYGLTPEMLRGRRLDEVLDEPAFGRRRHNLDALTPDDPVRQIVLGVPGRRIEWVDRLLPDAAGDEILSVGRDVTDQYRIEAKLRESEHRFELAMDDAPIGMALVGLDGSLLRVNHALCEFLGRSEQELLGMTTFDITHPADLAADLAYGEQLLHGMAPVTLEKRYLHADGSVVWGLLKVSLIRDDDGHPLYEVGQVVDITDRLAREASLEEAAAVERDAAQKLRDLDEMKNAFLTAVSHELRTPLTAVQGFTDLLRERRDELSEDDVRGVLDRLASSVRRLDEMLADLLDLDRLTRGSTFEPVLAPTDLADLLRRVVDAVEGDGADITTELIDAKIPVEATKIERVVHNLVSNAIRHTPFGTPIWVRLHRDNLGVVITVEDQGPGVADELKEPIFEAFVMGTSEAAKVGGSGVGLAIVRRFTELHGGRVWVDDRPGGGASFHVWLPDRSSARSVVESPT